MKLNKKDSNKGIALTERISLADNSKNNISQA